MNVPPLPAPDSSSPRDSRATPNRLGAIGYSGVEQQRTPALVVTALLAVVTAILAWKINAKWYPHDEGALGQAAERVLRGEVPHRDFDDIYTGLLTYLHAAAFAVGGVRAEVLRIPLLAVSIVWAGAVYCIARRFCGAVASALVTITIVLWSVPNYPAPLPSWYNLFCATFGSLSLLRWQEDRKRRWLVLAGVAGGVSFLFKLSGLFFLIGGGVAIVVASHSVAKRAERQSHSSSSVLLVGAGLGGFVAALAVPLLRAGTTEGARLLPPIVLVCLAATLAERQGGGRLLERVRQLVPSVALYVAGAALPMLVFGALFGAADALDDLLRGVFVTPFRRVSFAATHPPSAMLAVFSLAMGLLVSRRSSPDKARVLATALGVIGALVILGSGTRQELYWIGWYIGWGLPLLAAIGAVRLSMTRGVETTDLARRALTLCVVSAFVLLVEFPFAAPIYTLYALPVAMLAVVAVVRSRGAVAPELQLVSLGFFLVFGALRVLPGTVGALGVRYLPSRDETTLQLPRAGLRVRREHADLYGSLIPFVAARAKGGTLWAGPDAPEVYFLSGLPNRTRDLFDFLGDSTGGTESLAARISRIGPSVVVVNRKPGFSPTPDSDAVESLRSQFANSRAFGQFLVLWR